MGDARQPKGPTTKGKKRPSPEQARHASAEALAQRDFAVQRDSLDALLVRLSRAKETLGDAVRDVCAASAELREIGKRVRIDGSVPVPSSPQKPPMPVPLTRNVPRSAAIEFPPLPLEHLANESAAALGEMLNRMLGFADVIERAHFLRAYFGTQANGADASEPLSLTIARNKPDWSSYNAKYAANPASFGSTSGTDEQQDDADRRLIDRRRTEYSEAERKAAQAVLDQPEPQPHPEDSSGFARIGAAIRKAQRDNAVEVVKSASAAILTVAARKHGPKKHSK
jgi:hypothetical protein